MPAHAFRRTVARCGLAAVLGAAVALNGAVVPVANATPHAAITDLGSITPLDLVSDIVGRGLAVSDVTFEGNAAAAGRFVELPAVGFGSGIVLSTGRVQDLSRPHRAQDLSTDFGAVGAPELDSLAGDTTRDAAALSFTVVPDTGHLDFSYVFASEEYDEYVNTPYNDAFEFLVNGRNCAVTPDGRPVSVDSINAGNPTGDPARHHPELYRSNRPDPQSRIAPFDLRMDGMTKVLHCAADVRAHEPNTVKLVIADVGDGAMDTAVFVRASSVHANHRPQARVQNVRTAQDAPVPVTLDGHDPDGDGLGFRVVDPPAHGSLTGLAPDLLYTPQAGFSGRDQFTFVATDGSLDSEPARVAVDVESAAASGASALELLATADGDAGGGSLTSQPFGVSGPGQLLLAFVAAEGPPKQVQQVESITGGGLAWTLVKRANDTWGTSEVWRAVSDGPRSNVTVTATLANRGAALSLAVLAFDAGATVGDAAAASGTSGAAQVVITPSGPGSRVLAVGHDSSWDDEPLLSPAESMIHAHADHAAHDYFWVEQHVLPTTGTEPLTVGDTLDTAHRWQVVAVEVRPAPHSGDDSPRSGD